MRFSLFRVEAEPYVSPQAPELFHGIIAETAAKLKVIGDLERVEETRMAVGMGLHSGQAADGPSGSPVALLLSSLAVHSSKPLEGADHALDQGLPAEVTRSRNSPAAFSSSSRAPPGAKTCGRPSIPKPTTRALTCTQRCANPHSSRFQIKPDIVCRAL